MVEDREDHTLEVSGQKVDNQILRAKGLTGEVLLSGDQGQKDQIQTERDQELTGEVQKVHISEGLSQEEDLQIWRVQSLIGEVHLSGVQGLKELFWRVQGLQGNVQEVQILEN
ncbi:hypothetical protein EYF80_048934 [Liparis tanakae]|uniref:Uncharacterized protein n=1 Tax=Liparis tanakae TaxID=230148 RepID=A0A4Z2FIY6_9TELE|nr:hypothetical protein EYF80_048934 [Liparis tanakae]